MDAKEGEKPVNISRNRTSSFVTPSGEVVTIRPVKRKRKTRLVVTGAVEIKHSRIDKR